MVTNSDGGGGSRNDGYFTAIQHFKIVVGAGFLACAGYCTAEVGGSGP